MRLANVKFNYELQHHRKSVLQLWEDFNSVCCDPKVVLRDNVVRDNNVNANNIDNVKIKAFKCCRVFVFQNKCKCIVFSEA